MINKMNFIRKIKNNKFLTFLISVIILIVSYFIIRNIIDVYEFSNEDIIFENEESASGNDKKKGDFQNENKSERSWFERLLKGGDDISAEESGQDENEKEENEGEENKNEENKNEESSKKNPVNTDGTISEEEVNFEVSETTNIANEENNADKIFIYITGEINVPGVVTLNKGSRIVDAINAAGGITSKANISKVNLVFSLEDGMKVNIPNDADLKNNPDFEYITMSSGDGSSISSGINSGSDKVISSSNSGYSSGNNSSGEFSSYNVVNINTASQTELESLPGIGPSLALKIINYRNQYGRFSNIEEIKNVSGIGESKFEGLKKFIKV